MHPSVYLYGRGRNNLSNSNKIRSAEMAEKLFWAVFEHLGQLSPRFVSGKAGKRFAKSDRRGRSQEQCLERIHSLGHAGDRKGTPLTIHLLAMVTSNSSSIMQQSLGEGTDVTGDDPLCAKQM